MEYLYLKLIHLFAVVMFLGNIITGLFWMHIAVKTKDLKITSHTMKGIILLIGILPFPESLLLRQVE